MVPWCNTEYSWKRTLGSLKLTMVLGGFGPQAQFDPSVMNRGRVIGASRTDHMSNSDKQSEVRKCVFSDSIPVMKLISMCYLTLTTQPYSLGFQDVVTIDMLREAYPVLDVVDHNRRPKDSVSTADITSKMCLHT